MPTVVRSQNVKGVAAPGTSFRSYSIVFMRWKKIMVQWPLEIVDLDIVDSLVLVDKIVLTIYDFMK